MMREIDSLIERATDSNELMAGIDTGRCVGQVVREIKASRFLAMWNTLNNGLLFSAVATGKIARLARKFFGRPHGERPFELGISPARSQADLQHPGVVSISHDARQGFLLAMPRPDSMHLAKQAIQSECDPQGRLVFVQVPARMGGVVLDR